jgi:hypothetical protein
VLREAPGVGEVVRDAPLTLSADPRNHARTAIFESPETVFPRATLTLRARGRGEFDFRLKVAGAAIGVPARCPATTLTTTFLIDDGINPPATITTGALAWQCFGTGNRYIRTP